MATSKISTEAPTVTTLKSVFGGMAIGQYATPRGKCCKATLGNCVFVGQYVKFYSLQTLATINILHSYGKYQM